MRKRNTSSNHMRPKGTQFHFPTRTRPPLFSALACRLLSPIASLVLLPEVRLPLCFTFATPLSALIANHPLILPSGAKEFLKGRTPKRNTILELDLLHFRDRPQSPEHQTDKHYIWQVSQYDPSPSLLACPLTGSARCLDHHCSSS